MTAVRVTNATVVESETGSLLFPRVLSANLARRPGATVSASTAAAGFPAAAARTDNTYERWRPAALPAWWRLDIGSAQPCNACAIAAHDLASVGATITVQSSPDDIVWTNASDAAAAVSDGALLLLFPAITQRFLRLHIAGTTTPTIGHIRFGTVLTLEHGIAGPYVPIDYARRVTTRPSRSESGQWLGASVQRVGLRSETQITGLTWTWYRDQFDPFVREARGGGRPFFFAWQPARAPQHVAYVTLDEDVAPAHRAGEVVDVTLALSGFAA